MELALANHPPGKRYLIGVSGGRDSVALLHALHGLGYRKLVVCHVDHALRGRASTQDALFVKRLAQRLGLAFDYHVTGYGGLATSLEQAHTQATKTMTESIIQWQN